MAINSPIFPECLHECLEYLCSVRQAPEEAELLDELEQGTSLCESKSNELILVAVARGRGGTNRI